MSSEGMITFSCFCTPHFAGFVKRSSGNLVTKQKKKSYNFYVEKPSDSRDSRIQRNNTQPWKLPCTLMLAATQQDPAAGFHKHKVTARQKISRPRELLRELLCLSISTGVFITDDWPTLGMMLCCTYRFIKKLYHFIRKHLFTNNYKCSSPKFQKLNSTPTEVSGSVVTFCS